MLEHPGEESVRSQVGSDLHAEFDYARRLFSYWQSARLDRQVAKSNLSPVVLRAGLSLNTKACRQFRTIVDLCQRAEASDADTVSRALFETLLATMFVMKPRLYLTVEEQQDDKKNPKKDSQGRIRYRAIPVKKGQRRPKSVLSRETRAGMFVVGSFLQDYLVAKKSKNSPGTKRIGEAFERRIPTGFLTQAEQEVGWPWLSAIIEKGTYSGVDVSTLAQLVGLNTYYQSIYRVQSRAVHAAEAYRHLDFAGDACLRVWQSSIPEVRVTLSIALRLFLSTLMAISDEIPLGPVVATAIAAFQRELLSLDPA